MVCTTSCFISVVFIVGMLYMHFIACKNKTINKYKDQLTPELKNVYDKIVKERTKIYYQGYILGFALSLCIILYNYYIKHEKMSTLTIVCTVLATSFIVNYLYYTIHPKTDWMLDNITTPEQTKAWLKMYKEMQLNYHVGLAFGLVAVAFLAIAFRC